MVKKFDAIIIGSGVGGLVCACYLVKHGMRVALFEKHNIPGGYCTSFNKNSHYFDAAVHSLRGISPSNQLGIVLDDLNVRNKISLLRINPSEVIRLGGNTVSVFNDVKDTIANFQNAFPAIRKEIDEFFDFLLKNNFFTLYKLTRMLKFDDILVRYFGNKTAINHVFNILLGNLGLNSSKIAAISAIVFFRELFIDSGYYPLYGMQAFPNLLSRYFVEHGGDLHLSKEVSRVEVKNRKVYGVRLKNGEDYKCSVVVSNVSAKFLYLNLVDKNILGESYNKNVLRLKPTSSAFIVYLGLKRTYIPKVKCSTLWYFPTQKSTSCYNESFSGKLSFLGKYFVCGCSSFSNTAATTKNYAISLMAAAPWMNSTFWEQNRTRYSNDIMRLASKVLNIEQHDISYVDTATPHTLYRHTYNHEGALYGWASLPEQISKSTVPQKSRITGLYLCGHWATRGWGQGGISMVANSGRTTAKMILKNYKSYGIKIV